MGFRIKETRYSITFVLFCVVALWLRGQLGAIETLSREEHSGARYSFNCGPRALCVALSALGIKTNISECVRLSGTDNGYSNLAGLKQCAEAKGLRARVVKVNGTTDLFRNGIDLCIAQVLTGTEGVAEEKRIPHLVLVLGVGEENIELCDPGFSADILSVSRERFDSVFTGYALLLTRQKFPGSVKVIVGVVTSILICFLIGLFLLRRWRRCKMTFCLAFIFAGLLVGGGLGNCAATEDGNIHLRVDDGQVHDFGDIQQENGLQKLTHEFILTNISDQEVSIASIRSSCSCMSAQVSKRNLAPNEAVKLSVTLDVSGRTGHQSAVVVIESKAQDDTTNVIDVAVKAFIRRAYVVIPEVVRLTALPEARVEKEVHVIYTYPEPGLHFATKKIGIDADWIDCRFISSSAKEPRWDLIYLGESLDDATYERVDREELLFRISALAPSRPGDFKTSIIIHPTDKQLEPILIPVVLKVKLKVESVPPCIFLGRLGVNESYERKIRLVGLSKAKEIQNIETSLSNILTEIRRGDNNDMVLIVKFVLPFKEGVLREEIRIQIVNSNSDLVIPVYGIVVQ